MSKSFVQRLQFALATKLGWLALLLLGKLVRIETVGREHWERLVRQGASFILLVWHGKILLPVYAHRRQRIRALVSLHSDGEMIARTIRRLGYETIRGSSTRGGDQAFRQMVRALKQGAVGAAIIPDGPRGPRQYLKPGALYIAQLSGAYLLPLTFAASRYLRLKSWDRFTVMMPFSKCVLLYGEPIHLPRGLRGEAMERFRVEVERRMLDLEEKADAYFRK